MADESNDPLIQLVLDTDELDRNKLSELIKDFCGLSKDGQIRLLTKFSVLDTSSKILAIILAQKAAQALNLSDTDQILPKQIEAISGIPGGTVRGKLIELRQQRVVDGMDGNYSIPNHSLIHIVLNTVDVTENARNIKSRAQIPRKTRENSENLEKLLQLEQSQIGEDRLNLLLSPGKYLERALAVLTIAREAGIESLTPSEITQFLKEKIRVNVVRENISLALGRGTRYVDRFRAGQNGAFGYKIMVLGDRLLAEALITKTKE